MSTCGDFLAATALALALQSAGAGGLAVSGLMLAAVLPLVVLAPVTGWLADRGSRTLLVCAGVGQAAICVALAYADGMLLIIALVALLACGLAVIQPTIAALLPERVRQGAGMTGYLLGGLLLEGFAPRTLIAACGLAGLVVIGVVAIPVTRAVRGERKTPHAAWATSAASA